jgi:Domain of unknown function (DUF4278)
MKLIYRGATYDYDEAYVAARQPVERTSPYKLIYRGSTYWVDPTVKAETLLEPKVYELIYRGHTYQMSRNEQGKITSIESSTNSSKHQTLTLDSPANSIDC